MIILLDSMGKISARAQLWPEIRSRSDSLAGMRQQNEDKLLKGLDWHIKINYLRAKPA